jgi:hypothetical protein
LAFPAHRASLPGNRSPALLPITVTPLFLCPLHVWHNRGNRAKTLGAYATMPMHPTRSNQDDHIRVRKAAMPYSEDDKSTFFAEVRRNYQRLYHFIMRDLWILELAAFSVVKQHLFYSLQVVLITLRGFFFEHQCLLRSAALSYTNLLSLVPMLSFIFAFLKGIGVQNQLEQWLIEQISPGSQ